MNRYIVYSSKLIPSGIRGGLPDVIYTYIADDSHIGWHYATTRVREKAYIFDADELSHAEFIADAWRMKVHSLY